jgi:hypothetical protein
MKFFVENPEKTDYWKTVLEQLSFFFFDALF